MGMSLFFNKVAGQKSEGEVFPGYGSTVPTNL